MYSHKGNVFLCSYWDHPRWNDVTDGKIRSASKFAGRMLGYPARGIPLNYRNTHSLHTGGKYTLVASGHKDRDIQKRARWAPKSNAVMEYIQQQLSTFSAGVSAKMSTAPHFVNMDGAVVAEDLNGLTRN